MEGNKKEKRKEKTRGGGEEEEEVERIKVLIWIDWLIFRVNAFLWETFDLLNYET